MREEREKKRKESRREMRIMFCCFNDCLELIRSSSRITLRAMALCATVNRKIFIRSPEMPRQSSTPRQMEQNERKKKRKKLSISDNGARDKRDEISKT